ncbi:MAG: hypothetical protein CMP05_11610 [Xanthomarina sp.]|jgi:hypothetical protein|uniref:hypothetical protein n=1 Tax=Xanthomarina TaxID=1868329 RepID=UPI000C3AA64F|nr:hypothetical protein [Xanthomarina sp.]MAL23142.1 hypothetical protein [Xanthomarina sp.]MBF62629.1 hypothetical protein [Xanthomarina sp.]MDX1316176.1 hypothetical protein [Xanthomarina gelatinilytica]
MKILKLTFLLLLIFTTSCSDDADDKIITNSDPKYNTVEIIEADSDLFQYLVEIATDEEQPELSIACINFIYPLTIYTFNETNEYISTSVIEDDTQFSTFLEAIDLTYSISISFPITSTLLSGDEVIINTKEELKDAIDYCLDEELILECSTLIQNCVLKVGYSYNYDNTYLGGIFIEEDGATNFTMDGILFNGSWTVFIIEHELHININLINADETGDFFNYDWKVEYIDGNSLLLTNENRELVLNQRCDANFEECSNFIFEECETQVDSGISEFILDDYTYCIFDTLELEDTFEISYYLTEDDAVNMINALASDIAFINTEDNQSIYVRIDDLENNIQYYAIITLASISC